MGKIAYITAKAPYGALGETYILPEMLAIKKAGIDLIILPRDKSDELFHAIAKPLLADTLSLPLLDAAIAKSLFKIVIAQPAQFLNILINIVFRSRNPRIALKNMVILPKALYIAATLETENVLHIHAHYGSTTSTMAYIISSLTGIPWSFTVHRWDIPENNLLGIKCRTAAFLRAIDEKGKEEVLSIVNDPTQIDKVRVLHVGIEAGNHLIKDDRSDKMFTFLCPAMLVSKKGHRYLFEACRILSNRGMNFKCLVAGDGPLKRDLKSMVAHLGLGDCIEFLGALSSEEIFSLYQENRVDLVVLPSIVTDDGDKEGIPVALMEAMSYSIAVVSTNTGGIPELLDDGCGIMVREKDPVQLADAIGKLAHDKNYRASLGQSGKMKVEQDFNISNISAKLLSLFSAGASPQA